MTTLQSRVLILAGTGVLAASAIVSILSGLSLRSLESSIDRGQERLAAVVASAVARDVLADLEVLQGAIAAPGVQGAADDREARARALGAAQRELRVADAICFADATAAAVLCAPDTALQRMANPDLVRAVREAMASGRPTVTNFAHQDADTLDAAAIVPMIVATDGSRGAAVGLIRGARMQSVMPGADAAVLAIADQSGALATGPANLSRWSSADIARTPWTVRVGEANHDVADAVSSFRRRSFWVTPSLAGLALLLAWGISMSVQRPVHALTAAAVRISGGDLDRPIPVRGRDEIGRLASALEEMRVRLKQSIEEVEHANAVLEERVAARTSELFRLYRDLQDREHARQRLLRKVISAQEEERRRVARELHDETSQLLAALGMGLETAIRTPAAGRLAELKALVDRMQSGLHRMIVNLRPSVLDDLGLASAIEWLAEDQLRRIGITAKCELSELQDSRVDPSAEISVFRVVQEAVANIARHAEASTVLIQGGLDRGHLWIEVEDDGKGFELAAIDPAAGSLRGIGLLGMRERVELVDGELRIDTAPGRGTRVRIEVPVSVPEEAHA